VEDPIKTIPVKHIIIMIQGRHSFDNYFGTFPNADGFPTSVKLPSDPFDLNNSTYIEPFHLGNIENYRPKDDPPTYRLSYNNGSMNGFVYANKNDISNGSNVMGYYNGTDIPYYWKFASEYVLAQRFFGPSMRSDLVNSLYAIGVNASLNLQEVSDQGLDINNTIFDELETNKIPWKVYIENLNSIANVSSEEKKRLFKNIPIPAIPRFRDNQSLASHIDDLASYYHDVNNNRLPAVSYLYFTKSNDSPSSNVHSAHEFVTTLVYSLMRSHYWNNSAVIITHNEAGGWFDHVKPPINNITKELNGFRVPTIIISPYAKKGYIDNQTYDISSVLNFVRSSFGIKPHPNADNKTHSNIIQAFDFTKPPREPLYLEEISRERLVTRSNDVNGINIVYALSALGPIGITLYWYYRKRDTDAK